MEVTYRGRSVGTVQVEQDARGLTFRAVCRPQGTQVLRLYAQAGGAPLRIGVLEPQDDTLCLVRRWSPETMRRLGVREMPAQFFLDDGQGGCAPPENERPAASGPACPRLAGAVRQGLARWQPDARGGLVTAPFAPGREHPLAFALTACSIRCNEGEYMAELRCPAAAPAIQQKPIDLL